MGSPPFNMKRQDKMQQQVVIHQINLCCFILTFSSSGLQGSGCLCNSSFFEQKISQQTHKSLHFPCTWWILDIVDEAPRKLRHQSGTNHHKMNRTKISYGAQKKIQNPSTKPKYLVFILYNCNQMFVELWPWEEATILNKKIKKAFWAALEWHVSQSGASLLLAYFY